MSSSSEIAEVKFFIAQTKYAGLKAHLEIYLASLTFNSERPDNEVENTSSVMDIDEVPQAQPKIESAPSISVSSQAPQAQKPKVAYTGVYIPVENFSWDQGEYNSPTVTVYVDIPNVGTVKDNVKVDFDVNSFDLKVHGCDGRNYRLLKDNLDKDIVPEKSKFIVKKDKVVIKLQKKKGEYSYDSWTTLTAKKIKDKSAKETDKSKDPMGGLMDMMKDMYDEGDDNMKKIIGEAMLKSKSGEKPDMPSMDKGF